MKRNFCKITACLALVLSANIFISAAPTDQIKENNNKIEQKKQEKTRVEGEKIGLSAELTDVLNKLQDKQSEIDVVQGNVDALQTEIDTLQISIDDALNKISVTESEIAVTEADYLDKETKQKYQEDVLKKRVRRNYINNTYNEFLGIILESNSLSEILFKVKYVNDIMEMDKDTITLLKEIKEELIATKEKLNREKESLNNQKMSLEQQQNTIKEKQNLFLSEKAILDSEYASLDALENEKQSKIQQLSRASSSLSSEIQDLADENARLKADMESISSGSGNSGSSNNSGGPVQNKGFIRPTSGRLTSPYGPRIHPVSGKNSFHSGIDLANSFGTPIKATDGGTVARASYYGAYGKAIILDHGNGYSSLYAHMQAYNVSKGDRVSQGQQIGEMGSTGMSTGSHLHFEIWKNGAHQNPFNYIN